MSAGRRLWQLGVCSALVLGLVAVQAGPAAGQDKGKDKDQAEETWTVAVLNVVSEGADPKLATQITQVIKTEMKRNTRYQHVKQEDIALLDSLLVVGCEEPTPECMSLLAGSLGAQRLVYGRLVAINDLYDIEVNVFDNKSKSVIKRWNKRFTANADAIGFFVREMEEFLGDRQRAQPTRLRITCNVADANVVIDGQRVGRTPYFTDGIKPGKHTVEVTREAYTTWTYELNAEEGSESILRANLEPVTGGAVVVVPPQGDGKGQGNPETGPTPVGPVVDAGPTLGTWGWITLGTGVVVAGVGGIFGILALDTQSAFNDTRIQRDAYDLRDQGESQARTANILYGIGGGLGLAGLVLILIDSSEQPSAPAGPGASLSIEPVSPDGGWGVRVSTPF